MLNVVVTVVCFMKRKSFADSNFGQAALVNEIFNVNEFFVLLAK